MRKRGAARRGIRRVRIPRRRATPKEKAARAFIRLKRGLNLTLQNRGQAAVRVNPTDEAKRRGVSPAPDGGRSSAC